VQPQGRVLTCVAARDACGIIRAVIGEQYYFVTRVSKRAGEQILLIS
jgi:hypothetical protein